MDSTRILRVLGAVWGAGGTALFVGYASYRLFGYSQELTSQQLTILQWAVLVLWAGYMLYSEGVKAFGNSFSPRVMARAQYIAQRGQWHHIIFAPLFCFGYYAAERRRLAVTYGLTIGIIGFIIVVRFVPQPWRAIIDCGAALGLAYGFGTLLYEAWRLTRKQSIVREDEKGKSSNSR